MHLATDNKNFGKRKASSIWNSLPSELKEYFSINLLKNKLKSYLLNTTLTRYAQRAQTSADPEDPDFGLWTPGSEA